MRFTTFISLALSTDIHSKGPGIRSNLSYSISPAYQFIFCNIQYIILKFQVKTSNNLAKLDDGLNESPTVMVGEGGKKIKK